MRISIVGLRAFPSSFIGTSGVELYTEELLPEILKQTSFIFEIFTRSRYQSLAQKRIFLLPKIEVCSLPAMNSKVFEAVSSAFLSSCFAAVGNSEIVWYQGVGPAIFSWIPKLFGKKILLTVHSADWKRRKWSTVEKVLFTFFVRISLITADKVTTVSTMLQKDLLDEFGCSAIYTPPGFFLCNLKNQSAKKTKIRKKYVLFLGRIVPEKRVEWLLEAFLKYQSTFCTNLKLVIAGGSGNVPEYFQKLRKKYGRKGILWAGYVFGDQKQTLVNNARLFVLPSELEGNSISLLEAVSASVSILVGDSIVESPLQKLENIHTYDTKSFSDFQTRFEELLKKNSWNKNASLDMEKLAEQYSWKNTAKIFSGIFTSWVPVAGTLMTK